MLDKVTAKIQKQRIDFKRYSHLYHCSCGYKQETQVEGEFLCPSCGNDRIVLLDREYKTKQVRSNIEVVEKGLKHFILKRNKYRLVFHKDDTISVKLIQTEKLSFNLIEEVLKLEKDGEQLRLSDHKLIDKFFEGNESLFIETVSTPENKDFYRIMYAMMKVRVSGWNKKLSIGNTLIQMISNKYLEVLFFGGFTNKNTLTNIYERHSSSYNKKGNSPREIFNCDKPTVNLLRKIGNFDYYDIVTIKGLADKIGMNNVRDVFEIWMEENANIHYIGNFCHLFTQLVNIHGYTNYKRLADYVCREVKLQQGIDSPTSAMTLLRDYVNTNKELNHKWDKYPKSLKKVHDIASMNYKITQDNELKEKFNETIKKSDYNKLIYKTKELSIVKPKTTEDLIKEGDSLSHCIASYCKDVANGICKVFFLRKTENLDDSYMSIEVRSDKIRQVKGFDNRMPNKVEKEFIQKWATLKGLTIVGY